MKKHIYSFSPVYLALAISGIFSSTGYAENLKCQQGEIFGKSNALLKDCKLENFNDDYFKNVLKINNSTNIVVDNLTTSPPIYNLRISASKVDIKNSDIKSNNLSSRTLSIENNSDVNIENSTITAFPAKYSSLTNIEVNNSNLTMSNSVIRMSKEGDTIGWANAGLYVRNNGTATLKNTTFDLDAVAESFITVGGDSKIVLENSQHTSIRAPYFLTLENGKSTVELINSNFTGGIGTSWDLSKEIESISLDLFLTNSTLSSSGLFASSSEPPPDVKTTKLIENINIIANNSNLSGSVHIRPNSNGEFGDAKVNVTLNNSYWSFDKYSTKPKVTDLTLNNAKVDINPEVRPLYEFLKGRSFKEIFNFSANDDIPPEALEALEDEYTPKFYTFEILGNLAGEGIFQLNTDLANQASDQIIVRGSDSGSFKLDITDSRREPQAENGKVTLVKTQTGTAQFSLLNKQFIDAGAYRYRLNQEGNDWVLSNRQAERAEPTTPTDTAKPVTPTTPDTTSPVNPTVPTDNTATTQPTTPTDNSSVTPTTPSSAGQVVLSERSNALVSLRQAQLLQLEQSLVGIHQRLGELKQAEKGNVWVRNLNSRSELDGTRTADNSQSSGFKQDFHGVQIGADTAVTDNLRLGGFVGTERSNVDFDGEYGSGKLSGQSAGLYATYQADNGLYFDNIAKFSRLKAKSDSTGERRYNAYTLSSEIGKIYTLGEQWTITPNAQLAWNSIAGKNDEERLSSVYARVGTRVAKSIDLAGWKLQPYAEINGVTAKNKESVVNVNQYRFKVESSRGRAEAALGLNAVVGNHRFGVEAKTAHGKRLDQPFALQANYRYAW